MPIFFNPDGHKDRFIAALQKYNRICSTDGSIDSEYGSAFYILTSSHSIWEKSSAHIVSYGIDFGMLEIEDWSGGVVVLVRLAANLFNGNQHVDPREFRRLDDRNFEVAMQAIRILCQGCRITDL